jgi:aspartate racemase
MKTIGICMPTIEGGVICHQEIGREAMKRGDAYPPIVTNTPQFEGIEQAIKTDDFESLVTMLSNSINITAQTGAEFAIIPSNTPHVVHHRTAEKSRIRVLSILKSQPAIARNMATSALVYWGQTYCQMGSL